MECACGRPAETGHTIHQGSGRQWFWGGCRGCGIYVTADTMAGVTPKLADEIARRKVEMASPWWETAGLD